MALYYAASRVRDSNFTPDSPYSRPPGRPLFGPLPMSQLTREDVESWLPNPSPVNTFGLVGQLFATIDGLLLVLPRNLSANGDTQIAKKCQNEQERFFLWGQGLAVDSGKLDELLDTSTELRLRVLSLLFTLGNVVHRAMLRQQGSSPGKLGKECSMLQNQLDATSTLLEGFHQRTNDSDAFSDSETSEYDNEDLLDDLTTYVDCLMDLAPALEKPAMDNPDTMALSANPEVFCAANPQALIFCRKVRDRFKQLPKFLVERLGNANAGRSDKISALSARLEQQKEIPDDFSESLFSSSHPQVTDTTSSSQPSHSLFDKVGAIRKSSAPGDAESDDGSEETFASFSTTISTVDYGRPRVPPIPNDTGSFLCPFCCTWISGVTERKAWKEHVFRDLAPYLCTFEDCTEPATLHARSQTWAQHEMSHSPSKAGADRCVFCSETQAWGTSDYFKHVSAHLREVALSVLPPRADDDDDDDDASDASEDSIANLLLTCSIQAAQLGLHSPPEQDNWQDVPDGLWGSYKPLICKLLELNHSVDDVQEFMQEHCNFTASFAEYIARLDRWYAEGWPLNYKPISNSCNPCRASMVNCNGARDPCFNCVRRGIACVYDDASSSVVAEPVVEKVAFPEAESLKAVGGEKQDTVESNPKGSQHRFWISSEGHHEHYHLKEVNRKSALSLFKMPKFTRSRAKKESDKQTHAAATLEGRYDKPTAVCGKGAFSEVQIRARLDGDKRQLYAVKCFRHLPDETEKKYTKRLTAEFSLSSSFRHPNIAHSLDLLGSEKGEYYMVMELYTGGDLYTTIMAAGKLEVLEADCFFKQLIRGIDYLHEMGVAHRDLKPENLLLTTQGALKISDFGNAECFRLAWETDAHMVSGLCGSAPYISPEEYTDKEFDARAVDVWACGIIYMAMRTGRHLWRVAKKDDDEFYARYLLGRRDEEGYGPIESLHRARCRNVVYSLLDPNPARRLTASQTLKAEWLREISVCKAGQEGM
ncbi:Serine/threonine-protein kinase hal4 [Neonectria ditissima]|uniref:non-specific serine/threonine protein kinase n=1 Tax=Neonectria ditissima TaxID=78410 RepID=A0A0P7B7U3_9HYPO|nr:Serine/threonine-protein kinase hal4 [Neonectria ditissima]